VINGTIAWWIFGGSEVVSLAGPDSISNMLLPMSIIESTLTSFFGLLSGTQELRKKSVHNSNFTWKRWFVSAVKYSLVQGTFGLLAMLLAMIALRLLFPTLALISRVVPLVVAIVSGILAYVVHSQAVLKSTSLRN